MVLYLVDYHVHTKRCGHAGGKDRQYIERAIALGLNELGFADHVPRFYEPPTPQKVNERGMAWCDLDEYIRTMTDFKQEYQGDISLKLGLEVDYVPGWEREIERIGGNYPWDYLIGSVHFFPEWNYGYIARETEHGPEEIFPLYFQRVAEAAESHLFDTLGHIDLPKRTFQRLASPVMAELHRELAARLGKADAVIELNTYGIRGSKLSNVGLYPDRALLLLCQQAGVRVTLGSDAHRPQDVGADFETAVRLLETCGFDEIVTYQKRQVTLVAWRDSPP